MRTIFLALSLAITPAWALSAAEPPAPAGTAPGPLARAAAASRAALDAAGLERVELEVDGRRLVAWRGGHGPHLVFLHGSGQQAGAWAAVIPPLLDGFTVHTLDLPGHGDSEPVEGPLAFATIVAGMNGYLATLDGPAILVGNSMGAWLATLAAHGHPERVSRIVLVNGGALLNIPAEGLSLTPVDREAARRLMAALRDPASPPLPDEVLDDIVLRSRTGPIGRLMGDMGGLMAHLLEGRLGEISVPVDLLWGASDRLMPVDYARRMEGQLPSARLTLLEACGHIPESECPERFLAALREVLASPPPEASADAEPAEGREEADGAGVEGGR